MNSSNIKEMLKDFYPFAKERMGFDRTPRIKFLTDPQNSQDPLGKTAFYESDNDTVSVYIHNRHPKDILRSISHELVHHTQNCRGQLSDISAVGEQGYAQNDLHLREMERQAYEMGNMTFRDWEDGYKMSRENNMELPLKENEMIEEMAKAIIKNLQKGKVIKLSEELGDPAGEADATRAHQARQDKVAQDRKEKRSSEEEAVKAFINSEPDMSALTSKDFKRGDGTPYKGHQLPIADLLSPLSAAQMIASHQPLMDYVQKNVKTGDSVSGAGGEAISGKELLSALELELKAGGELRKSSPGYEVDERIIKEKNMNNTKEIKAEGASSPKDKDGNSRYVKHPDTGESGVVVSVLDGAQGVRYAQSGMTTHAKGINLQPSDESTYKSEKKSMNEDLNLKLRNMVGEQIKAALEGAILSEEESEDGADEVSIDVDVDVDDGHDEAEEKETIEEKIRSAVQGAIAPAPLSLKEKVKNAIQSALLQEDDGKDDDDDELESSEKHDDNPALKGDQDELPDELQKGIIDAKEDDEDKEKNEGYKSTSYNRDEDDEDEELNEQDFEYATDPQQEIVSLLKEPPAELNAVPADNGAPSVNMGDLITHFETKHGGEAIGTFQGTLEDLIGDGFVVKQNDELYLRYPDNPLGKGVNEGYSRLAQAGKRELNIRHNRLFETLKNKWIK